MATQPKKKRAEDSTLPVDAGTKPIQLQRRRVWRACESCRRKKIKCDGNEPTCTQCSASGSQCTWLQTKDRAALSRHYVQELEARLVHMENLFAQVAPVLDRNGELPPGLTREGVVTAPDQPGTNGTPTNTPPTASQSVEPNVKMEEELEEPFGQLTLDEHGHMRWIGGSSTMSLINSFRYLTNEPKMRVSPLENETQGSIFSANKLFFPAAVFFGKVRALPGPEEVEYPERDLADKLVDAYFSRLHCLMPVVDKPSFLSKYKSLMENTSSVEYHRSQTAFVSLVFAMFACAARLVDDPRLKKGDDLDDGGVGMIYYERALILHHISHASIQPTHVQCLLLMSSFLCSVNCLPQAWLIIGQAVRSAQDLGLHRSPRRLQITPIEKETRRKIWWGVYTMDRMLALALGRPLGADDCDCDVEPIVPVDDEDLPAYFNGVDITNNRPSLMAGTLALHQLYHIAGRVLRQVYSIENTRENLDQEKRAELDRSVESLDLELTKWCDDLPIVLKSSPQTERDVAVGAILCSHYYLVINTLHRNFLPVKRDHIANPRSVTRAVASSRACIALAPSISHIIPPSHHLAFFIQNLFSSVVIILLFAMHTNDEISAATAMDSAHSSLAALEGWEGVWPGARKCRELLSELARTTAEAIRAGSSGPQVPASATPLSVSITGMQSQQMPGSPLSPTTRWEPSPLGGNGRAVRNKPRRDRSHDPYSHSRQSSRSGAGFRDALAQRARSASRRRPLEDEGLDSHSSIFQYPGISNHSSPASVRTAPSPKATPEVSHAQPASPSLNSPTFGLSQVHIASPARPFDYAFGLASPTTPIAPPPGLGGIGADWSHATQQAGSSDGLMYLTQPSASDASMLYGNSVSPALGALESPFYGFESSGTSATTAGTSSMPASAGVQAPSTPPWASFAAPGLPFPGLDLLRNYDPTGGNPTFDESLWQTIDPSAFREPELPWSLGDLSSIEEGAQTHN